MKNFNLEKNFSDILSEELGLRYAIGEEHVHTDFGGWSVFIPKKSLLPNHPLLMRHYRGPLFVVIPHMDAEALVDEASVKKYITEATWSIGYYWGGSSIIYGAFWQPIGRIDDGILDKETLNEYLKILGCRTCNRASGFVPDKKHCDECFLEKCWYSRHKKDSVPLPEVDARKELYSEIYDLILRKYGFRTDNLSIYTDLGENEVIISPNFQRGRVTVHVSSKVMVDLLYHPDEDVSKIIKNLEFFVKEPNGFDENDNFFVGKMEKLTETSTAEDLVDFWRKTIKIFEWDEK